MRFKMPLQTTELFPCTVEDSRTCMEEMEGEWHFSFSFGAFDGCHIPLKCPHRGAEACKDFIILQIP